MQRYEIFQTHASRRATWVESASGLRDAMNRVRELTRMFPASYFILDRKNSSFIVPFDRGAKKAAESSR
jgi:hypothetical protein